MSFSTNCKFLEQNLWGKDLNNVKRWSVIVTNKMQHNKKLSCNVYHQDGSTYHRKGCKSVIKHRLFTGVFKAAEWWISVYMKRKKVSFPDAVKMSFTLWCGMQCNYWLYVFQSEPALFSLGICLVLWVSLKRMCIFCIFIFPLSLQGCIMPRIA